MTKSEWEDAVAFLDEGVGHANKTLCELALFVSASQETIAKLVARVEELESCENLQCQRYRRETDQ